MRAKPGAWLDRNLMQGPFFRLCLSEKDYIAQLDELEIPAHLRYSFDGGKAAHAAQYKSPTGQLVVMVCMDRDTAAKNSPIPIAGLLVHEAVHIWQAHCEDIGEHKPGDEQEAYAIQWISQQLMWSFEKQIGTPTHKR